MPTTKPEDEILHLRAVAPMISQYVLTKHIGVHNVVFGLRFPPADASTESEQFVVVNLARTPCHTYAQQGLEYSGFQHPYHKM